MTYYNFDKLENLVDGDILFFDELLNGNPVVLNACLTILEQRKFISGKPLPNIMIVAAANPQGMSPLTPQIKERFVWYNVSFDSKMWCDYMFKKYLLITPIAIKLVNLMQSEDFITNNFYTPRSVDKAVDMIINGISTPYNATITPILEILVENKIKKNVEIGGEHELVPNEKISWLELIRRRNNINLVDTNEIETDKITNTYDYEILIMDDKYVVIGGVTSIKMLKKMYYFTEQEIQDLEMGLVVSPPSIPTLPIILFSKKIK